ncbi:hypothetical protein JYB64_22030, partial [Algoriphagus aestuarii]|nr:hypothetical protein [Algoriphagus aestuarii]
MRSRKNEQGSPDIIAIKEEVFLDTVFGMRDSIACPDYSGWPIKINSNHMKKTLTLLIITSGLVFGSLGTADAQKSKVRYADEQMAEMNYK